MKNLLHNQLMESNSLRRKKRQVKKRSRSQKESHQLLKMVTSLKKKMQLMGTKIRKKSLKKTLKRKKSKRPSRNRKSVLRRK